MDESSITQSHFVPSFQAVKLTSQGWHVDSFAGRFVWSRYLFSFFEDTAKIFPHSFLQSSTVVVMDRSPRIDAFVAKGFKNGLTANNKHW